MRYLVLLALLLGGCKVQHLREVCPRCELLEPERPPSVPAGTRRVFVLVPGILGYGWEWNGVQVALRKDPGHLVLVADWDPWQSLARGSARVAQGLAVLLGGLPPSVTEVVVLGHSVGGLVAALAAARVPPPEGLRLRVATVGAPYAGMHISLFDYDGPLHGVSFFAVGGVFRAWPRPAPGVELWVYPTTWPRDPVMRPRMGHDPGQLSALPGGARLCGLPAGMDHNLAISWVAERLRDPQGACEPPGGRILATERGAGVPGAAP
jgi:pimeloyl-ACP methyl ester carboxylesterase